MNTKPATKEPCHALWSIGRRKTDEGGTYPIRLEWKMPITEAQVRAWIGNAQTVGDDDFKDFKFFDVWHPTA